MPANPHGDWVCGNWEKVYYNYFTTNGFEKLKILNKGEPTDYKNTS